VRVSRAALDIVNNSINSRISSDMASLRLFPMAARLQAAPLRSVVRHFATGAHTAPSAPVTSRLGNTAFFTSSQPKIQFLAGALGRAGNSVPTSAASAAGRGRPAWAPTSLTSAIFRRAFSTSRRALARPQYYGHGGGQGWQPPPKPSFWQQILRRLDRIDATRLVYGMIAVNVAVFLLWQYAINSAVG
jgi:hypothetical protein